MTRGIVIPPGAGSSLDITLSTAKCKETLVKYAYMDSNDPAKPQYEIRVKAVLDNPKQMLNYAPLFADFGQIAKGAKAERTIKLTNNNPFDVKLVVIDSPDQKYVSKYKIKDTELKSGESTEIVFTLADNIHSGIFYTSITLEGEGKPETRISITIKGVTIG